MTEATFRFERAPQERVQAFRDRVCENLDAAGVLLPLDFDATLTIAIDEATTYLVVHANDQPGPLEAKIVGH